MMMLFMARINEVILLICSSRAWRERIGVVLLGHGILLRLVIIDYILVIVLLHRFHVPRFPLVEHLIVIEDESVHWKGVLVV